MRGLYSQALLAGGAGKPGVWQLPWGIKQEKEKSLGRKQHHQARPWQVPVLQQPHQSQTGWKLCGIRATYLWPFSTIAPCFKLEMVQRGLVVGNIKGKVKSWPFRIKGMCIFFCTLIAQNHTYNQDAHISQVICCPQLSCHNKSDEKDIFCNLG